MLGLSGEPASPIGRPLLRVQVAAGLHGAFLLARGRPEGFRFTSLSPEGPVRSFWAMALCLPAFLGLRLLGLGTGLSDDVARKTAAAELIGYIITWTGFALVSHRAASRIGRAEEWPRFVAAWNWCNVVQYLVLVVLLLSPPGLPGMLLGLAALGYAMWLEWFVARASLRLGGAQAAGVVGLDLALSLLVSGLVEQVSRG